MKIDIMRKLLLLIVVSVVMITGYETMEAKASEVGVHESFVQNDKGIVEVNTMKLASNPGHWSKLRFIQWFVAFCGILEFAFTIYVAVICIKKKPKLWGLWLLLILIVYGGVSFAATENIRMGIFVHTFLMPQILVYQAGIQVILSVPIGAIIYLLVNNKKDKKEIKENILDETE